MGTRTYERTGGVSWCGKCGAQRRAFKATRSVVLVVLILSTPTFHHRTPASLLWLDSSLLSTYGHIGFSVGINLIVFFHVYTSAHSLFPVPVQPSFSTLW